MPDEDLLTKQRVADLEPACALPAVVRGMADKAASTIFHRRDGSVVGVPYPQCHDDVLALAAALQARGVGPGERVAIHGTTSYEWVLADLGCLVTGAVSVALYPSAPARRVMATAAESRCRLVFTDREELIAGFVNAGLEVIFLGPDGPAGVPSVGQLVESGGSETPVASPVVERSGPFTVVSTSGTLSEPKLFAVHSAPLLYTMDRFAELYRFDGRDRLLLYLPLSHLPQRMMLYWGLDKGLDFVLSDPARIVTDSVELAPTLHVTVPRALDHLHARMIRTLSSQSPDDDAAARAAKAVFGPSIKAVFVGSAPSQPAVLDALARASVPVYEVYGTTELGMIALNTPGATRTGTVGRAIPWGAVRLASETDEILVRTPTPFLYGRLVAGDVVPEAWAEGEWWPTGDVGQLDEDGFLSIRGRLRDFLALRSGEKVFVRPIEDAAARATDASLCVVMQVPGRGLGALLFFDPFDPTTSAAAESGARAESHLRARLQELNGRLHPWERLQAFAVVEQMPSVEDGCMTETTKLRRHKIEEVHGHHANWRAVREG